MYLVTKQQLDMFDIISLEGFMYQVTGHAGDGYLLDEIEFNKENENAARDDFDVDAVTEFENETDCSIC
jgi:hypothetical protein